MFSLQPQDAMEVRLAAAMDSDPVLIQVSKVDDKPFVSLTKRNTALHHILKKGVAKEYASSWVRKLPCTNIIEQLKQLKDEKYNEALKTCPKKRARGYKAFILSLPETTTIEAPAVGEIAGMSIRVLLSYLVFSKCHCLVVFFVFSAVLEIVSS
jgi:hypothetical protein